MRTGTIFAKTAEGSHILVASPDVSVDEQRTIFQKMAGTAGLEIEGKKITQIVQYTSIGGGMKKRRIKEKKSKPAKKTPEGFVSSLKDLAAALEIGEADLKKLRDENQDTFPGKAEDGYEVEVIKAWADGLKTD